MARPGKFRSAAIERGRKRADARSRREDFMATQGRNIIRKTPGEDVGKGFRGDLADIGKDLSRLPIIKETLGMGSDLSGLPVIKETLGMGSDILKSGIARLPKLAWMHGADAAADMFDALSAGEKARVGGKFNAPLDIGTSAYNWLLNDVIKDEYEGDFRKEVGKGNLHWTELNKFAKDKYIGGGQLAKGINARNEGIINTGVGREAMDDAIGVGASLHGTGPIGDAAFDAAKAYEDERAGKIELPSLFESALPEEVIDITPVGFGEQLDYDELSGEFFPRKAKEQSGVFGRGNKPMTQEEFDFQMAIAREAYPRPIDEQTTELGDAQIAEDIARRDRRINAIDAFMPTPPRRNFSIPPIDERTGDAQIAEDIAEWRRRIGGIDDFMPTPPGMNFDERINAIDAFEPTPPRRNPYTGVNPFRTPYYPMIDEEENYPFLNI